MGYHSDGFPWSREQEEQIEVETKSYRKTAISALVGGFAISAVSLLTASAETDKPVGEEPFRIKGPGISINVEDRDDLPFILAGAGGLVISGMAAEYLQQRRKD